jgi:hypothetical protein
MGKHEGQAALRAARTPRARRRSHPETLAVGLLVVLALLTAAGFAIRSLYSDYQWHSSALSASTEVARAIQNASARDDSPPVPVDAVPAGPGPGQVTVNTLAYAAEIPADVTRIRLGAGGGLSVTMRSGALCSGVTFDMSSSDDTPYRIVRMWRQPAAAGASRPCRDGARCLRLPVVAALTGTDRGLRGGLLP